MIFKRKDKNCSELSLQYLDKINMLPYINTYDDIYDLYNAISEDYDNSELTDNRFLDGDIFRYINPFQLEEYIENKYYVYYDLDTAFGEYF